MDDNTGRIYENIEDLLKAEKLTRKDVEQNPKRFVPFANKEQIEWKGCLFEIKEIRPDPDNEIVLKGLPALIGIEDITKVGDRK